VRRGWRDHIKKTSGQAWWGVPVIPALRRLKKVDLKFRVLLDCTLRPNLKKRKASDVIERISFLYKTLKKLRSGEGL
jgi:hypothetical protein